MHLDVVDGQFVPFSSWPYEPAGNPTEVLTLCDSRTLEVDLMVENPLPAARAWIAAGADMLVFHIETISVAALTAFAEETAVTIGVSALNDTSDDLLRPYLDIADYVQVMGIREIGAQGQPFDDRALVRIAWIRSVASEMVISIDGSVNVSTLPQLVAQKLNRYIVGSAITRADVPLAVYQNFSTVALQQVSAD